MLYDPRWPSHRGRMGANAIDVTKFTVFPDEIEKVVGLRKKGRTFDYLAEELCLSAKVLRRELRATGSTPGRSGQSAARSVGSGSGGRSTDPGPSAPVHVRPTTLLHMGDPAAAPPIAALGLQGLGSAIVPNRLGKGGAGRG